jgi:hypothetical protein
MNTFTRTVNNDEITVVTLSLVPIDAFSLNINAEVFFYFERHTLQDWYFCTFYCTLRLNFHISIEDGPSR